MDSNVGMYWSSLEGGEVLDVDDGDVVVAQECGLNRACRIKLTSKKMVMLVVKLTCFCWLCNPFILKW
jgi:hypothetical protein